MVWSMVWIVNQADHKKLLLALRALQARLRKYERHAATVAGRTRRETVRLAAKARSRCYREVVLSIAAIIEDSCS